MPISGPPWVVTNQGGAMLTGRDADAARANTQAAPADLDWLSMRGTFDWTLLTIPTPYSPAHVLHPSVLYFPSGWRGYRYWMAHTPYPDSDSERENPCVCASNDARSWVAVGLQPLVESPAGVAFNSDVDLAYDVAQDRIVMVYRASGVPTSTQMELRVMTTSDGVNWTPPVAIFTGSQIATASAIDIASPSLMFNSTTSRWEILGHQVRDNASAWPWVKITSAALESGWDTVLTTLTFDPPSGRKWWHSQFRRLSGGAYVGLVQDNAGTLGSQGNLYAAYSLDGTTFTAKLIEDVAVSNNPAYYRPSFVIAQDQSTREWVVQAFASRLTTSGILTQTMRFDAAGEGVRQTNELESLLSAGALGGFGRTVLHSDTFNRADDATGLGTASGGGTYTQAGAPTNVIGVIGNQAYHVTTGNCRAVRDMGRANYQARVTFATKSADMWLRVRQVDDSNFVRIGVVNTVSQLTFQVITGGSAVVNTALGVTPANGDEIMARCNGGEIVVFVNGRRVHKAIVAQGVTTGTFVGLQMAGTLGGRVDNFAVTPSL